MHHSYFAGPSPAIKRSRFSPTEQQLGDHDHWIEPSLSLSLCSGSLQSKRSYTHALARIMSKWCGRVQSEPPSTSACLCATLEIGMLTKTTPCIHHTACAVPLKMQTCHLNTLVSSCNIFKIVNQKPNEYHIACEVLNWVSIFWLIHKWLTQLIVIYVYTILVYLKVTKCLLLNSE